MGMCMTKKAQSSFHPKSLLGKRAVNNDANLLLDQWNEKHIEILKNKFQEVISKNEKGGGPFRTTSSGNQGLDKAGFMMVFADLKKFPKQVAESAFRLFDRDRSGFIDFREFCCGLSIITLSSTNEKIRFVFDLFDLDKDGYLNRQELKTLLETSVQSFRKFCKGPSDQIDKQWIEHHLKIMMSSASYGGDQTGNVQSEPHNKIDFFTFKQWAEKNLNFYHLLNTFMLVPSPVRERKEIIEILSHYERKHGDTMYALSFRWWETWKEYTNQHQSTKDQNQYVELIKESLTDQNEGAPDDIRNFLLPYYEELKEADINEVMQRQDLIMEYSGNGQLDKSLKREFSKAKLLVTPRSEKAEAFPDVDVDDLSLAGAEDHQPSRFQHLSKKGLSQLNLMMKLKEQQQFMSKRSQNYSSQISREDLQSQIAVYSSQHSKRPQIVIPGAESPSMLPYQSQPVSKRNLIKANSRQLKQLTKLDQADFPLSSHPSMIVEEDSNNEIKISQSFRYISNNGPVNVFERPTEIDNSDIEGEHPGQLKPNLILHRDFIMLPEAAWVSLQKWYGGGPAFPRKVIINNMIPTIELYPPLITSVLAGTDGHPIQDSARSLFVSIAMRLSEVFLKVCESFNYISTKDARLWFKEGGNQWKLIDKGTLMEKTLEDFIVKDGDVFMVEMRFGETWPRDKVLLNGSTSGQQKEGDGKADWRQFEVGDRIDIFDNNEWKIGIIQRVLKDKLMIHLLNEHWKNDVMIPKDFELIDRYGSHTLEMHFKTTHSLLNEEIPPEFTGLENIGNTCYINAVLQSLFHTPLFRDFFISKNFSQNLSQKALLAGSKDNSKEKMITLAQSFSDLLVESVKQNLDQKKRQQASLAPVGFKKVVNQDLPMFFGSQQHDAQEFLNFLLDKLSENLNRAELEEEEEKKELKPSSSPQLSQEKPKEQTAEQVSKPAEITEQRPPAAVSATGSAEIKRSEQEVDGSTGGMNQAINIEEHVAEQPPNQNSGELVGNNQSSGQLQESQNQMSHVAKSTTSSVFLLLPPQKPMTTNEQIYHSYFQPTIGHSSMRNSTPVRDRGQSGAKNIPDANQMSASTLQSNQGAGSTHAGVSTFNISANPNVNLNPLLLDPSLTEAERKSIESWQREMRVQSSAISDLFVGQQGTSVQCQQCMNRTSAFENFYTLSLPLPYNSNAIFYITVMKRSTPYVITPIVKYGIQIDKNAKLSDLMHQIERLSNLKEGRQMVSEVVNSKIYRVHSREDDSSQQQQTITLRQIYRRTNELTVFECLTKNVDLPIQPNEAKKSLPSRTLQKPVKSLTEIKMGTILDALDSYGKWYSGIVVDRDFDYDQKQFSIKIHFLEFPERWDEWFKEGNEVLARIAPFATYGQEPKDTVLLMPMMHRKRVAIGEGTQSRDPLSTSVQAVQEPGQEPFQYQTFGLPFQLSIGNWYTWEELYVEVITQAQRFIKTTRLPGGGTKSQRGGTNGQPLKSTFEAKVNHDENISDSEMGEEKSSQIIYKYDSSYFSKKMQDAEIKKGPPHAQMISTTPQVHAGMMSQSSPNMEIDQMLMMHQVNQTFDQTKVMKRQHINELHISQTPTISKQADINAEIQLVIDRRREGTVGLNSPMRSSTHRLGGQNKKGQQLMKSFNETLLVQGLSNSANNHVEMQRLPFTVSILDAETHLCAICSFNSKYMSEVKQSEPVTCRGCDIYQNNDKVKWILVCFKRLEICIDWKDQTCYKNPLVTSDMTCLQYLQQEKELQLGVPLQKCFELFSNKEQIDDYSCDQCKKSTPAIVQTQVSRAPDILIIHLKRFSYQSGYLEKIEDLVNFPLINLDISQYLSSGFKRHKVSGNGSVPQRSHQYDLYAVVNHIMYHNSGGGHYTAYVQGDGVNPSASKKPENQLWFKCNDSSISKVDKADLISKDAYILFYKRKEFSASNIINFTAPSY